MTDAFFKIKTPRDMLEKAKRDFIKMRSHLDTDTIFNFFVTAYHVKDYVETHNKALEADIEKKSKDEEDFKMCEYICNKGKHLELSNEEKRYPYQKQHRKAAVFGEVMFDEVTFNQSESYSLIAGGREVDVMALGQRILDEWDKYFAENGI